MSILFHIFQGTKHIFWTTVRDGVQSTITQHGTKDAFSTPLKNRKLKKTYFGNPAFSNRKLNKFTGFLTCESNNKNNIVELFQILKDTHFLTNTIHLCIFCMETFTDE